MRERIGRLKREMLEEKRFLSTEQAKIIVRVHREKAEEPACIRRACALAAAFDEIQISIGEGEQIVGNRTVGVRSGVVFPECGILWLEKELDGLSDRKQDPFYVKREDAEWIRHTLLPEWKNRCLEYKIAQETGGEDQKLSSVIKTNQQGRAQGHIIPDIPLWLSKGPAGLLKEAKSCLTQENMTREQTDFYQSVILSLEGVQRFWSDMRCLRKRRVSRVSTIMNRKNIWR